MDNILEEIPRFSETLNLGWKTNNVLGMNVSQVSDRMTYCDVNVRDDLTPAAFQEEEEFEEEQEQEQQEEEREQQQFPMSVGHTFNW